jgi:hypothetical protein
VSITLLLCINAFGNYIIIYKYIFYYLHFGHTEPPKMFCTGACSEATRALPRDVRSKKDAGMCDLVARTGRS